ncbi:triphosphoribosyl-dephospho-CoA synthase CitG [Treponema zioleckii]|uniref:triphosphoribosyl-dephospho-CoA synthase CitG n=1 Tax=Treponema zioleckii TaxID=331680 RepID=UPI00168A5059|nr:triphosphoribosyl-dephospho-CoA synthase CitG [Treponema zioleckii]
MIYPESQICEFIEKALLSEVYTTPKPGLVDKHDTGAHRDMDVSTFEKSTAAISPFLAKMYGAGVEFSENPENLCDEKLFAVIRKIGVDAEKAMFAATNGVNTHKGIIFTLGIICASLGFTLKRHKNLQNDFFDDSDELIDDFLDEVFLNAKKMTFETLEKDFALMASREPKTHGEKLFAKYGEKGIRGEAQKGFPIIYKVALPFYKKLLKVNPDENNRNIIALLHIVKNLSDTNVLSRSSPETLRWLQSECDSILGEKTVFAPEDIERVCKLNEECVQKNISPGGAADILAVTVFLAAVSGL